MKISDGCSTLIVSKDEAFNQSVLIQIRDEEVALTLSQVKELIEELTKLLNEK